MKNIVENQDIKTDKDEIEGLRNQLAAVIAERDALAAENAALKSSVDLIARAYTEGEPAGFEIERARHIETPATDAAVAAIEAQAVEDAVKQVLSVDTIASTAVISHLLRAYATELLEGK